MGTGRAKRLRRWGYAAWLVAIAGFAALHAWHLRADFPNGSPWIFDWAKYTDEGWYGNAAIRAHLLGNWYVPGDFNLAAAVPFWPFAEWVLFFFTGVTVEAARGLAIACFFLSLALSYLLLRSRGQHSDPADEDRSTTPADKNRLPGARLSAGAPVFHPTDKDLSVGAPAWAALLGVTLAVTSPFLYCFSRLAILEPLEITLTLAALNVAVRLPRMKRPVLAAVWIGVLFALMNLTKTTAIFLAPAVGWAMLAPLWRERRIALRCAAAAAAAAALTYGAWMTLIAGCGFLGDYNYFFHANNWPRPAEWDWPLAAFWWSLHGLLWIDHSLVLLAGGLTLAAAMAWRTEWGRRLRHDPVFGASLLAVAGFVLMMTMRNHPQPRYYAVPAFFAFFVVAMGAAALVEQAGWARRLGWVAILAAVAAAGVHGAQMIGYAAHPEYTWVNAAGQLTQYVDAHPNGKRLLAATSGDEITLITHLPAVCDELGSGNLAFRLATYQPGWFASWNDLDPDTLQQLHTRFSLEQVASFRAFDSPERRVLVLFKLHPLAGGEARNPADPSLRDVMPEDKIDIPVE